MPWGSYVNKVKTRPCPCCGKERPWDWFLKDKRPESDKRCWKCRETRREYDDELIG